MYTDDISQNSFKTKVINLHGSGDFTDSVGVSFDSDSCRTKTSLLTFMFVCMLLIVA